MAEVVGLIKMFLFILWTCTVLNAYENNFKKRSIYLSNSLIEKRVKRSATFINVGDNYEPSNPSSSVKSLHLEKRDFAEKGNITTKITRINDTHQQLMVHWVGIGSDVIICLAKTPPGRVPSSLYISYDYGDSFKNKTEFFALTDDKKSYASLDKFYVHPKYINHIVFSDVINSVIFTTTDSGKTFTRNKLSFSPSEVSFHEDEPFTFLAHDKVSSSRELWLTRDFGQTWHRIQESVKTFYWSGSSVPTVSSNVPNVIPMKKYSYNNDSSLLLFVERVEPSGKSTVLSSPSMFQNTSGTKVWMSGLEDFKIVDDFMFVIKAVQKVRVFNLKSLKKGADVKANFEFSENLDLYVSYKRGPFVKAIFQSELDRLDYHILDVSEGQIFVAVSHTETLSHLYASQTMNNKNIFFALSLERILCFFPNSTWRDSWLPDVTEESFADLHKVEGLRGIYIASQVQPTADSSNIGPEHLLTLITFDRGGEWRPLTPPPIDDDGLPIKCNPDEGCSLHLSQKFNQLYPPTRSVPILSSASAPGIIMATGTIGKSLKGHPRVFLSRDGGLTWRQILKDYYFFNFGDHGGVLVAVKYYRTMSETRELLYSTDEGERFLSHKFHTENLKVYGLMTEPGGNTTVFTMFGSAMGHHQWLIIKVDLRNAFSYDCTPDDYKFWSPSSKTGPKMPCILGKKETFERRIAHSNCYNGKNYDRPIKVEICECDIEDFECDFGFERSVNLQQCIRNKTFDYNPYEIPSTCTPGGFYNRTKGYKKIPGDVCVDVNERKYLPDTLPCPLEEKKEFLLVAQRDKINRIDLKDLSAEVLPILNLKNVIAIEFDMRNNCVYWADITLDVIGRQCFNNGTSSPEILVENNSSSIEGMALDWVSNNLYFVDGMRPSVEVIRTDIRNQGRMRRTILGKKDVKKPRGIAVHPMAGYMFWTDWAVGEPSVSRANLNGSDIRRLFTKPVVEWPNGITIDHIAERIYWVDARQDYIASSDLDGRRFKKIITHDERVSHPFAVAVFKDFVYWDDWRQSSVFVADKDHGVGIQAVLQSISGPMDLKIFAHNYQEGTNLCGNTTVQKCSHLCMGGPGNTYSCLCPQEMVLIDGHCYCPGKKEPDEKGACPSVGHTCAPNYFMCANKLCIPVNWRCDNDDDCGDGSDELNCVKTLCASNMFLCPSGECIPEPWRCDFDIDCRDGADEKNCTYSPCKSNEFSCKNGRCINLRYRCDSENDCQDNSDEENCPSVNATCKPEEFKCGKSCIPKSWRCDGEKDCANNEDEENCVPPTCTPKQFQCEDKTLCIDSNWVCDMEYDCADKSDEKNCTYSTGTPVISVTKLPHEFEHSCNEWTFKCHNGNCIPYWWKCDQVKDCEDNSDEIGCDSETATKPHILPTSKPASSSSICKANQFRCYSGRCIPNAWVCDGDLDCLSNEDESKCPGQVNCSSNEFMCRTDGSCVLLTQLCDGKVDCPDGSDETFCENGKPVPPKNATRCGLGFFNCDGSRCIPLTLVCDGHVACTDNTDEKNCNDFKKVYQVLEMGVDPRSVTSTSLLLFWWIPLPLNVRFKFLPSISESVNGVAEKWKNETWIEGSEYRFKNLKPYTNYRMTVYVKVDGSDTVFPPAEFVDSTTSIEAPSAPWNVSVTQKSYKSVLVSWLPPKTPNGPVTSYVVRMSPPIPPVVSSVSGLSTNVTLESEFVQNRTYSFWVTAKNDELESYPSGIEVELNSSAFVNSVEMLKIVSKSENIVKLSWKPVPNVDGYRVQTLIPYNFSYPKLPEINVSKEATSVTVTNLAPGVIYKFEVSAYRQSYPGPVSSVEAKTEGSGLPYLTGLNGYEAMGLVHLKWNVPVYPGKIKWEYGVYHAVRMEDLFESSPIKVFNTSVTVRNLSACESYLFSVRLLGPLGVGPLTPPVTLTTSFSPEAPPKKLMVKPHAKDENVMVVQWESSCKLMTQPIGYEIVVTEINLNKSSSFTLLPTDSSELKHSFKTHYGGRYAITVSTSDSKAVPTFPVYYDAPEIPPPHQVQVFTEPNGTITVMWNESELPAEIRLATYKYRVYVSEGNNLNLSAAQHYEAESSPFTFSDAKEGVMYSFAVQLVMNDGYTSRISEINSYKLPLGSFSGKYILPSSFVSITVPILLPLLTLGAVLGFFVYRHRRLKRNLGNYANSHYDTRSGSTTFVGADGLDDEDSPNIRGFSDDEPLVMA